MDDGEIEKWGEKGSEGNGSDHSCGWHHGWQEIKFWMCGIKGSSSPEGCSCFPPVVFDCYSLVMIYILRQSSC